MINACIGGTGYLNNNAGALYNFSRAHSGRAQQRCLCAGGDVPFLWHERLERQRHFWLGRRDSVMGDHPALFSSDDPDDPRIQRDSAIFISGVPTSPHSDRLPIQASMSSSRPPIASLNDPNLFYIPICTAPDGPWWTGSGGGGVPTGSGTSDFIAPGQVSGIVITNPGTGYAVNDCLAFSDGVPGDIEGFHDLPFS